MATLSTQKLKDQTLRPFLALNLPNLQPILSLKPLNHLPELRPKLSHLKHTLPLLPISRLHINSQIHPPKPASFFMQPAHIPEPVHRQIGQCLVQFVSIFLCLFASPFVFTSLSVLFRERLIEKLVARRRSHVRSAGGEEFGDVFLVPGREVGRGKFGGGRARADENDARSGWIHGWCWVGVGFGGNVRRDDWFVKGSFWMTVRGEWR